MKILVPTADYPPIEGGIATVTLNLARELSSLGHEVTVVAPYLDESKEFDAGEPYAVRRYRGYRLGWFRFFPMAIATAPLLRGTDLVLGINIAYGGVIGMLAKWILKKPYVTFAYAYEFLKFERNPFFSGLIRRAYARSDLAVAISEFTREQLVGFGVPEGLVTVILPGTPEARAVPGDVVDRVREKLVLNGEPVVLSVGRMIPRKGHAVLVEAMARVLEKRPEALLVCVGRGPALPDATRRATELGIRDSVRFAGRLSDEEVDALYEMCDVFALPTGHDAKGHVEGFGLVFTEAQARGKAVVGGRSGGVVDAVIDGETGLLVEPNDPVALADAVTRLLDDPEEAGRLGANGKKRVETELNWGVFTEKLLGALGKVA